ncbi:MAG: diguanylate cyclase [Nitrospiraceae bacterium]
MIDYHLPLVSISEAILVLSENLTIDFANPAALRMMCFEGDCPRDLSLRDLFEASSVAVAQEVESVLTLTGHWSGDIWLRRADADASPLPVRLVVDRYQDGNGTRHACIMSDISQRMQTEARLRELSQLDSLTGLFNRAYFLRQLESKLHTLRREERQYALLFVDVDDLKEINDTQGHHIGDLCLREVARRLRLAIQRSQHAVGEHSPDASETLVARMGGDEFVILLPVSTGDEALHIARTIGHVMNDPWQSGEGQQLTISTSIGIAYAPLHGSSSEQLLQLADRAMYEAKSSRKGSVHEFIWQRQPQDQLGFETGFDTLTTES